MGWEHELVALFDDLEGSAAAAWEAEREAEVLDRAQTEYAAVTLASRLMASVGLEVTFELPHLGRIHGVLDRVARDWCLVRDGNRTWLVVTARLVVARGTSPRSVPEVAWSPVANLGLGSALRRLAGAAMPCVLHLTDGSRHEVVPQRLGSDFIECRTPAGETVLVAYAGVVAVQGREEPDVLA